MLEILGLCLAAWVVLHLTQYISKRVRTTPLGGPPRLSPVLGVSGLLEDTPDPAQLYEEWSRSYGSIFRIPTVLGANRMVLCDPKAIAYFYTHESFTFVRTKFSQTLVEKLIGRGLLWAEGEDHKRQRKAMSPAFSVAALKNALPVFFDSGYKVKTAWDAIIDSELQSKNSAVIDVQTWMNHVSLDSIGIAGFSHNFGTLEGKRSNIADAFDAIGNAKPSAVGRIIFTLASAFPVLLQIPSRRSKRISELEQNMEVIAARLLQNTREEKAGSQKNEDRSIIGTLIKAESSVNGLWMSPQEVASQMKLLIVAGYETTSISLAWTLVELSRKPEIQENLRKELNAYGSDPTWDDLIHGLPYLDAVFHEVLRLHPAVPETIRQSNRDDVLPLSEPLQLPSGETVDRVAICAGQIISVPIISVNRSATIWGPDAKEFKPERWLNPDGLPERAQEIQGHRHLLTFADGPRTCLGRHFAQAEFKAVLTVLIRNFAFELRDGKGTQIETKRGLLPRPIVTGEEGIRLPLLVRRLD